MASIAVASAAAAPATPTRPNIILAMADDMGWGDIGCHGHPTLKTPALDEMARNGLRFERFYSASPVCSPTRGSCLTGRHPFRYGIIGANAGTGNDPSRYILPENEITIASVLRDNGYATGHFGKWHLGDFDGPMKCSPSDRGFDAWFSTVRKVTTNDPQGYWENGQPVTQTLEGDDSKILMDRALDFMRASAKSNKPFFCVIWFHAPHEPVVAADRLRALYPECGEAEQHYFGVISGLDEQIGRLRTELRESGTRENTMIWFCSDNGNVFQYVDPIVGSSGGLRAGKGTLYEGGVRVPGILEWPSMIPAARVTSEPVVTSDYLPTILDALAIDPPDQRPLDGVSILPLLKGESWRRPTPICFEHGKTAAIIDGTKKLIAKTDGAKIEAPELYDLAHDRSELNNIASGRTSDVASMLDMLRKWRESVQRSAGGTDYADKKVT